MPAQTCVCREATGLHRHVALGAPVQASLHTPPAAASIHRGGLGPLLLSWNPWCEYWGYYNDTTGVIMGIVRVTYYG